MGEAGRAGSGINQEHRQRSAGGRGAKQNGGGQIKRLSEKRMITNWNKDKSGQREVEGK